MLSTVFYRKKKDSATRSLTVETQFFVYLFPLPIVRHRLQPFLFIFDAAMTSYRCLLLSLIIFLSSSNPFVLPVCMSINIIIDTTLVGRFLFYWFGAGEREFGLGLALNWKPARYRQTSGLTSGRFFLFKDSFNFAYLANYQSVVLHIIVYGWKGNETCRLFLSRLLRYKRLLILSPHYLATCEPILWSQTPSTLLYVPLNSAMHRGGIPVQRPHIRQAWLQE